MNHVTETTNQTLYSIALADRDKSVIHEYNNTVIIETEHLVLAGNNLSIKGS